MANIAREVNDEEFEQHLKNIDIYGYCVVSEFLQNSVVEDLRSKVDARWAEVAQGVYGGRPERDDKDQVIYNLQNKDKIFIDILGAPFVERLCSAKLNDEYYRFLPISCPNYILNYYNARSSGAKLDLHIDSHIPNPGIYTNAMQVVYVLDDMNDSNGCTVVVPGSHRSGEFSDRGLVDVKSVCAKRGDLVIWDSRLWHGTRENSAKSSRWALIATMSRWWMKQAMDIPAALPQNIYEQLTDRQKLLMGFCSLPPKSEWERINTKCGYGFLKPSVSDYR